MLLPQSNRAINYIGIFLKSEEMDYFQRLIRSRLRA